MTKSAPHYDVHPSVAIAQKWIAELKSTTGHSFDEWLHLIQQSAPKDEKSCRDWLKSEHRLGTNYAAWLAERAAGKGGDLDSPAQYLAAAPRCVAEQYAAKKSHLLAIYWELLELGRSLGPDVKVCPCKTMVPLYRNHVFAQIKPTTNSRIDLGLCFTTCKGKLPKRLIDTGGLAKKNRITHRIELTSTAGIDADLKKWLRTAYDLDSTASTRSKPAKLF